MKAGIFLDIENLSRSGGWALQYGVVKQLVEAQGAAVLRANAYMAIDKERESNDFQYRTRKSQFRDIVRRYGFHLVLKEVRRYRNDEGQIYMKADADQDLAVDAILQSENLDYVLLGSGDGDFLRLVRALQNKGKRVDVFAFSNVSGELREEADYYFNGYLFPNLLPVTKGKEKRLRGFMHAVVENKGFGFVTIQNGLKYDDFRQDVFLHILDTADGYGNRLTNEQFAALKTHQNIIDFDLAADGNRIKAIDAVVLGDEQLLNLVQR